MFSIKADLGKMSEVGSMINTVEATLKSDRHVSTLIKAAHDLTAGEFILHMSRVSVTTKSFNHMYEWNRVGDPNEKLWRHVLKGNGSSRTAFFEFKASRRIVPVDPQLQKVGVKKIHVFVWKAMVLETGMPVRISPKLAKYLVFLDKRGGQGVTSGKGYKTGGIIYFKGTISIAHAGNSTIQGSFTREWTDWWNSGTPERIIKDNLTKPALDAIKKTVSEKIGTFARLKEKNKSFTIKPIAVDPNLQRKLEESLTKNYIAAAAQRKMLVNND
jgi:hypothetical protein